jgi:hypothetical protein
MILIACFLMNPQSKSPGVPRDQRSGLPRNRGGHVRVVIWVGPVNLGDQPPIALDGNTGIRKELPDCGGDGCSSVGGAAALPDYHAHPLVEEVIAPHNVVDPVLGQREHEIHDREREQDVRVNEYLGHEQ